MLLLFVSKKEAHFMKTVTLSNRFYYRELNEKDASAIKNDILLYNQMLHKAYKYLILKYQGINWDFDSLQKEMKRLYHTNDYFPLSVIWKAKLYSNVTMSSTSCLSNRKNINSKESNSKSMRNRKTLE